MMQLTIIGFGNQARSWALNLRDSGIPVRVALRPRSPSHSEATREKIQIVEIGTEDFYRSSAIALLIPDDAQEEFLADHGKKFSAGTVVLYAHGYAVSRFSLEKKYGELRHVLYAPKAIGTELRRQYLLKGKLGAVYSLEHVKGNASAIEAWVKDIAKNMGITMGPYKTTFLRETNADLYSEQGLLCSLIPYAASEMFNHLVKEGTEPELAYFECWHELKLIINAMVDKGPEGFFDLISPNALIGAEKGFQRLMSEDFKKRMHSLLEDIKSGKFDDEVKSANLPKLRQEIRERWQNDELNKTFLRINS
jgi:ketol-acid reductoisomerase